MGTLNTQWQRWRTKFSEELPSEIRGQIEAGQERLTGSLADVMRRAVDTAKQEAISVFRGAESGQAFEAEARKQAIADYVSHPLFILGVALFFIWLLVRRG